MLSTANNCGHFNIYEQDKLQALQGYCWLKNVRGHFAEHTQLELLLLPRHFVENYIC